VCQCIDVQNRELQIMRKLDHDNIVRLRYFFYSSGDKVMNTLQTVGHVVDIFEGASCYQGYEISRLCFGI